MTDKELTEDQRKIVEEFKEKWLTDEQIAQYPSDRIIAHVRMNLEKHKQGGAKIEVVECPQEARRLSAKKDGIKYDDTRLRFYSGLWWSYLAGYYEAANAIGYECTEGWEDFVEWNRVCPIWIWDDDTVYAMRRPKKIYWDEERSVLHNESGPAVEFCPEFNCWAINGVEVDEQIVMKPETQTIEQMEKDANSDRRAIRIERFGWHRYLLETGANVVDERENIVEGTWEILYEKDGQKRMVATCNTAEKATMRVGDGVETCDQSSKWLPPVPLEIMSAT